MRRLELAMNDEACGAVMISWGGAHVLLGRSRASRFVRFRRLGCQRRGGIFLSCLAASDETDR